MKNRPVYFDNAATTAVDPRVREAMEPALGGACGNPDSQGHAYGWEAEEMVAVARESVARLIGARADEIVFTGSATEANNLALRGMVRGRSPSGVHLVVSQVEHMALLGPARALRDEGSLLTEVPPDADGRIDAARIEAALRPETLLVSVMQANNEIGVVQDLAAIGAICERRGIFFHTDATQAFGKIPIDVETMGIHLLSCSAHKIHGPKGVGALYVRRRSPRVPLRPLVEGGGQERGLRSGTLNVPGIVGLGAACGICAAEMEDEGARVGALRQRLEGGILAGIPGARIHGSAARRLPGITSLGFPPGLTAEAMQPELRGVALSAGSACASGRREPSHVLLAMGRSAEEARRALRYSLGRFNTVAEVDAVIEETIRVASRLRSRPAAGRDDRDRPLLGDGERRTQP